MFKLLVGVSMAVGANQLLSCDNPLSRRMHADEGKEAWVDIFAIQLTKKVIVMADEKISIPKYCIENNQNDLLDDNNENSNLNRDDADGSDSDETSSNDDHDSIVNLSIDQFVRGMKSGSIRYHSLPPIRVIHHGARYISVQGSDAYVYALRQLVQEELPFRDLKFRAIILKEAFARVQLTSLREKSQDSIDNIVLYDLSQVQLVNERPQDSEEAYKSIYPDTISIGHVQPIIPNIEEYLDESRKNTLLQVMLQYEPGKYKPLEVCHDQGVFYTCDIELFSIYKDIVDQRKTLGIRNELMIPVNHSDLKLREVKLLFLKSHFRKFQQQQSPKNNLTNTEQTNNDQHSLSSIETSEMVINSSNMATAQPSEVNECMVCMEQNKDCALNCGHVYCNRCAYALKRCPMCDSVVSTRLKLYL
ncbi:hypothetical protein C9374_013232 [Naegleria lovaniensis]|uniref:RING-type domain-containing protein n=1 Tax=Naegleria lovaniensis TaxID=51637 RepID=A0AA88KPY9_NAELO|nr:uncharacterized protein C9374_013232 [Naegleria lovaniensis]KAG2391747.1 hypothetical protein C9374_013232 [Naegleria lovaniensis]